MKPSAASPRTTLPTRCLAAFLLSALAAGCGGGPRLSLSPSKWPGAARVAETGKTIGGLVPLRSKSSRSTAAAKESVVSQSQWSRQQPSDTAAKGRPIYDGRLWGGAKEPVDPFLARARAANSRSDGTPPWSDGVRRRNESNALSARNSGLLPVGHELSGPELKSRDESTPADVPAPAADEIPFADLAGTLPTRTESAGETPNDVNRFAAGFDSQLADLRGQPEVTSPQEAAPALPLESNPLRDAILGLPENPAANKAIATVAGVDEPWGEAEEPAGRAVVGPSDAGGDDIPEWAQSRPAEPQPAPSLPVADPAAEAQPPAVAAEELLPPRVAVNESTLPPVDIDEMLPSAIEIVPAPTEIDADSLFPGDSAAAAERVELLPAPAESTGESFDLVEDDFTGMIVATDNLPSGFAEWDEPAADASDPRGGFDRVAKHSPQPTADPALEAEENLEDIFLGEDPAVIIQPRDVEAAPETVVGPQLFLPTGGGETAENELDSVHWDPETEPGAVSNASPFQSTLVVTLLIGLACAIGIAVIRRMYAPL